METDVELTLGLMDLDLCPLEGKPIITNNGVSVGTKSKIEKWNGQTC